MPKSPVQGPTMQNPFRDLNVGNRPKKAPLKVGRPKGGKAMKAMPLAKPKAVAKVKQPVFKGTKAAPSKMIEKAPKAPKPFDLGE